MIYAAQYHMKNLRYRLIAIPQLMLYFQLYKVKPKKTDHLAMSLEGSVKYEVTLLQESVTATAYEEEVEDFEPPKALGDVLESVAGALFLDSDMSLEVVWMKFFPFFKPLIGICIHSSICIMQC